MMLRIDYNWIIQLMQDIHNNFACETRTFRHWPLRLKLQFGEYRSTSREDNVKTQTQKQQKNRFSKVLKFNQQVHSRRQNIQKWPKCTQLPRIQYPSLYMFTSGPLPVKIPGSAHRISPFEILRNKILKLQNLTRPLVSRLLTKTICFKAVNAADTVME